MSYAEAHNEIREHLFMSWADATPIAWPNVNFTPPNPQSSWIRLSISDGDSNQMELGSNPATIRYAGIIYVQIFTRLDIGDAVALQLADTVKQIFNNWCGVSVRCRAAKIKVIGNDGNGWYQVNVVVPFYRDERL